MPSCADDNSSLFVVGVIAISKSACVAKPDPSSTLLTGGVVDTVFTDRYTAIALVGNQLVRRGSHDQLRTETARIALLGAEIKLQSVDGSREYDSYSTNGTGFIDPATGDTPGYGIMAVDVIPAGELGRLNIVKMNAMDTAPNSADVIAKIRVFGETLGNQSITSSELSYPISLCRGCLIQYIIDPTTGECTTAPSTTAASDICIVGQDQAVPCNLCSGTTTECVKP